VLAQVLEGGYWRSHCRGHEERLFVGPGEDEVGRCDSQGADV